METEWIFWIVGILIAVSVAAELLTGRTRLRGLGIFERVGDPRRYWLSIGLKALILLFVTVIYVLKFH